MGTVIHRAVLVTTSKRREGGLPDMDAFRAEMPAELRGLVMGPAEAAVNGYVNYVFLPSGSKTGFDTDDATQEWQAKFFDLFSSPHDEAVGLNWGQDLEREPLILNWR